jgi:aspartyl-tRNA(Asn)/glutamyl-tRNA(Gln) amidotransferase subunit A
LAIDTQFTIHETHQLLKNKKVSSVELTQSALERVRKVDPQIRALVTVSEDLAMQQAARADKLISEGQITRGIKTTCSSKMLENFVPPYNATVIEKLNACGMVMIGKANMDEFAMGSSTENSAFFTTHNPWDLDRVPGGSSGGSAASVAAGEAFYALGSDTGGSIRQPAGFCSVTGLKPTYGRVSRYGLVAFASSLDQIGPLTRDVLDSALVMNCISGIDRSDSTSAPIDVPDFTKNLTTDLKGMRIGIPKEYFVQGMTPEVKAVMEAAIKKVQELGADIDWEVSLPHTSYSLAVYYIIAPCEASANLARYDGVKYGFSYKNAQNMWDAMEKTRQYGFGPEVKRRIMLGTYALSSGYYDAYYLKAQKVRTLIRREFDQAFTKYDALLTPTSPTLPFRIGEKANDPVQMYLSDVCTLPINIAGVPALSVPAGFAAGLPVGMQIIGKPFSESTLFKIGYAFQQATDWHQKRPQI